VSSNLTLSANRSLGSTKSPEAILDDANASALRAAARDGRSIKGPFLGALLLAPRKAAITPEQINKANAEYWTPDSNAPRVPLIDMRSF